MKDRLPPLLLLLLSFLSPPPPSSRPSDWLSQGVFSRRGSNASPFASPYNIPALPFGETANGVEDFLEGPRVMRGSGAGDGEEPGEHRPLFSWLLPSEEDAREWERQVWGVGGRSGFGSDSDFVSAHEGD